MAPAGVVPALSAMTPAPTGMNPDDLAPAPTGMDYLDRNSGLLHSSYPDTESSLELGKLFETDPLQNEGKSTHLNIL
ncbi:hypothetical protein PGTUg99_025945 [Puccinia graminis f. sp. tritici]|uniref:Uncharacterized protein n=1 Tax=Puccinia graminis f. sp. tritici TaxID=56615 RepID=A0A5B0R6H5_PUCGR|nr:hypothetical protein PGTUg99_025945 [Puccinia graminis f. sp. tritici]